MQSMLRWQRGPATLSAVRTCLMLFSGCTTGCPLACCASLPLTALTCHPNLRVGPVLTCQAWQAGTSSTKTIEAAPTIKQTWALSR